MKRWSNLSSRTPWWAWHHTFAFYVIAEAYGRAGQPERGLSVLAEIPKGSFDTMYASEIYRCRADQLLRQGPAHMPEAEN